MHDLLVTNRAPNLSPAPSFRGPNPGPQKTIVVNDKISNRSQRWEVTGAHAYRSGPMGRYEAFSRELGLSGTAADQEE